MKIRFTLCLILFYLTANAQTINFKINGEILNSKNASYAYLTTLSQQIPISSDKIFIKVPVVNGKFEFNSSFDLEGKNFQFAAVFFDERGNITKEEVALKFKNIIWVTEREPNLLKIVLEDMTIQSKGRDEMLTAEITENGIYTKQYNEYRIAARAGRRDLVDFIIKYKDSPISLEALQSLDFADPSPNSKESLSSVFYQLTPALRNSKDGQEMKKRLNIN